MLDFSWCGEFRVEGTDNKMEATHRSYIGIMEKRMEATNY